jgi:hypothetical protein
VVVEESEDLGQHLLGRIRRLGFTAFANFPDRHIGVTSWLESRWLWDALASVRLS